MEGTELERSVAIEAHDLPTLLARWLDELVFLSETDGLVANSAVISLDGTRLTASVRGATGTPRPLVKGATLHGLQFRQRDGTWCGRVVLDV